MKPTFSVNFQSKNRQQGMQLLSMCVDVLEQLIAANMAAAMLVDGKFIATNSDMVMAVYHRCVNIAKTYGLDFTFNLSPVENEPEYVEPVVAINNKWVISEQRAKELQDKEQKQLDFNAQYQMEMNLENVDQSNDEFTVPSEKDLIEHDNACEVYAIKLHGNFINLDNWDPSGYSQLESIVNNHIEFNEHSQMDLEVSIEQKEEKAFDPFSNPDETVNTQLTFGRQPRFSVKVSDSNSVNLDKWEPSAASDYEGYDYYQDFKHPEMEEDFEHNQQDLDIDYTKDFNINEELTLDKEFECTCIDEEELDFNKEFIVNTGEIAKQLGQTFDKVCELHEEIPRDFITDSLDYYWDSSGCSYDDGQY